MKRGRNVTKKRSLISSNRSFKSQSLLRKQAHPPETCTNISRLAENLPNATLSTRLQQFINEENLYYLVGKTYLENYPHGRSRLTSAVWNANRDLKLCFSIYHQTGLDPLIILFKTLSYLLRSMLKSQIVNPTRFYSGKLYFSVVPDI